MTSDAIEAEKAALRQLMRAERKLCDAASAGLALIDTFPLELARLSPVGGYWPVGSEIDPRPLLAALVKAGAVVALPRMQSRAGPVAYYIWRVGDALSADAFGVPAPPPLGQPVAPRLVLAPLLAFDRTGARLGQGGGHYDRIIPPLRAHGAVVAGLAFAAQEVARAPAEPHDARLDWVVTEREAIRCG